MKKKIVNISLIIVGILVVSVIGTKAASAISSSMVTYNDTTVKETLDDLVDITVKGDATSADITSGKTAVVQGELVTGTYKAPSATVFEITLTTGNGTSASPASAYITEYYDNYQNITIDDIVVQPIGAWYTLSSSQNPPMGALTYAYDPATGLLTMTPTNQYMGAYAGSMKCKVAIINNH